jgi:hypothetical protein
MRKLNVVACLAMLALGTTMLYGQATRTWVSGVGDDANPCSRTAPCKTFAGAISKTAPGGEIDALDPGGFGALTITKSITLDGGGGQVASVLVAGTNGIVVAAQPGDVVIIRNLRLDGLMGAGNSNAGLSGIRFISGKALILENDVIFGFNNSGIDLEVGASASVDIINTTVENIGTCVPGSCLAGQGVAIFAKTSAGTLSVSARNTTVALASNNGVEAGSGTIFNFDNGSVTNAHNGLTADAGGTIVVGHATVAYNNGTAYNAAGGSIFAYSYGTPASANNGTNRVHDNGAQGTATYISEN